MVVDTDYDPDLGGPHRDEKETDEEERKKQKKKKKKSASSCVFYGTSKPYSRAAIFPWGRAKQKGPDGET